MLASPNRLTQPENPLPCQPAGTPGVSCPGSVKRGAPVCPPFPSGAGVLGSPPVPMETKATVQCAGSLASFFVGCAGRGALLLLSAIGARTSVVLRLVRPGRRAGRFSSSADGRGRRRGGP